MVKAPIAALQRDVAAEPAGTEVLKPREMARAQRMV